MKSEQDRNQIEILTLKVDEINLNIEKKKTSKKGNILNYS
jgi:hypothetical protein